MNGYRNELRSWQRPGTVAEMMSADAKRFILIRWWKRWRSPLPYFWHEAPNPNWACKRNGEHVW